MEVERCRKRAALFVWKGIDGKWWDFSVLLAWDTSV